MTEEKQDVYVHPDNKFLNRVLVLARTVATAWNRHRIVAEDDDADYMIYNLLRSLEELDKGVQNY
jgi:hypothetical protein